MQGPKFGFWSVNINNKIGWIYALELAALTIQFHWRITGKRLSTKIVGIFLFSVRFRTVMKNYDWVRRIVEFLFLDPEVFVKIYPIKFNVRLVWGELVSLRNWKSLLHVFVIEKKLS